MARDVFRPGLSSDFLKELLGNCRLFINPTEQELSKGLFSQQRRCTRQLIDAEKMIEIWCRYCQGELEIASPVAGVECPSCYRFGLETSVFQAVRISDRLSGVVIARERITPKLVCACRLPMGNSILVNPV